MAENKKIYPELVIKPDTNPSRLLAFPVLGILIKTFLLIPVFIEGIFLGIAALFFLLITPFVILFTGKYWESAYDFLMGYFKFSTKIQLYYFGITDKYPGFGLDDNGVFTLKIEKPKSSSRLLAFPVLGFVIRAILLIPFRIFGAVLGYGEFIAVVLSWFFVLFSGKYSESFFEFGYDTIRVSLASQMYLFYLSDSYPSFAMKIKNQTVKILLIIAGILLVVSRLASAFYQAKSQNRSHYQNYNYNYRNK